MKTTLSASCIQFESAWRRVCRTSSDLLPQLVPPSFGSLRSAFTALLLLPLAVSASEGDAFFRERVEPILQQRCFECHSHAEKIKGGLGLIVMDYLQLAETSGFESREQGIGIIAACQLVLMGGPEYARWEGSLCLKRTTAWQAEDAR